MRRCCEVNSLIYQERVRNFGKGLLIKGYGKLTSKKCLNAIILTSEVILSGTINWLPMYFGRQYAYQNKSRIAMNYYVLQSKGILVQRYHISTLKLH